MINCEVCGQGPQQGITVYRQNEKGIKGQWRCAEHSKVIPDPVVEEVVKAIEAGKQNGS